MFSRMHLVYLPLLAVSSATSDVPGIPTMCACTQLYDTYPGKVLLTTSANYTAETESYWDVRADLHPACIFQPDTADEVADAIKLLSSNDVQFAIRGGGHMNFPGSNNIDGGVLITLSKFTEYTVNNDTIEVGPGMTWYDVYEALEPYGRAAIGGRLKTIGVPGLTLIGGVHYFINKYGYAMDNVVNYDVVLGNGTQVKANRISHPDLFWALKGGANNFGLVTKFTLKTYHIPQISTTIQLYNESYIKDFIKATCELASLDDPEPIAAGAVITVQYNATTKVVGASILGVQAGVSNPPSQFTNFSTIPGEIKINNVTTLQQWASGLDTPKQMFRVMFSHKAIFPNTDRLYEIYQTWKEAVDQISDVQGLFPTFVMNTAPAGAARVALTNGVGNVWGLKAEPAVWWQFSTGWDLASDDLRITSWSRQLTENLHRVNEELGLARDHVYMGDAGEWQNPFDSFPEASVDRMRTIRAAYDPSGTFSRLNWGGFKLGY
ncbi:hypothetical protein OIDMADRAFT_44918 [Oidiodendron maius Zn]|uniref:FAD-binding PCMH-type domain-containing protein n=1 Tax=Oidiodendron maius (strain Zn) TaxID=913774 RepID=A0A0C3CBB1_OIDMZ|nr:hypothetical protein OIDMADRAFT_44918 [Oidiodendron maius Zn]